MDPTNGSTFLANQAHAIMAKDNNAQHVIEYYDSKAPVYDQVSAEFSFFL